MVVGAIIRYAATKTPVTHLNVEPVSSVPSYNQSLPPDTLWMKVSSISICIISYLYHSHINNNFHRKLIYRMAFIAFHYVCMQIQFLSRHCYFSITGDVRKMYICNNENVYVKANFSGGWARRLRKFIEF